MNTILKLVVRLSIFIILQYAKQSFPCSLAFSIPSAVKSADGSNIPFIVPSDIAYDDLHIMIAEKLRCFPGLLRLRYRLESDKPRTSATSLQSTDEMRFFLERMRGLIVPQRLPSGKISSRTLKPVCVYFEDAADEKDTSVLNSKSGGSKKVRHTVSPLLLFDLLGITGYIWNVPFICCFDKLIRQQNESPPG